MTALKEAAHNLLDTLKKAEKTPGDIKVSIVPFAVDVNVGTGNVDASWIDWTDWEARQNRPPAATRVRCRSNGSSNTTGQQLHAIDVATAKHIVKTDYDSARTPGPPCQHTWTNAQHLERLRDGSRPEQRRRCNTATGGGAVDQLPRPSGLGLSDGDDAAVHRLDRAATPRSTP